MKTAILTIIFFITVNPVSSQDWPVKKLITGKKERGSIFTSYAPFTFTGNKTLNERGAYQELDLNGDFKTELLKNRPEAIQLSIPLGINDILTCELVKTDLGNVQFTQNRSQPVHDIIKPVCYRGLVSGEQKKNTVTLTINEDYFSLNLMFSGKTIEITQIDANKGTYRLYNTENIDFPAISFDCGTKKQPSLEALNAMQSASQMNGTTASQDKCVYVFVECFDSLYQWRNSSYQQTIDYVYALFNNVATGYLNEFINIKISNINVWTATDPYRGDNRENALVDLSAYYQDNFWGNICVGLDYSISQAPGRSGLASAIGRVKGEAPNNCPAYTIADNPFCYNDLDYNVSVTNFPTGANVTQQQVYLVMHEMGHLLGSSHTHWCGWLINTSPVTYGALDNCADPEGSCPGGPAPPASGGTIMSYCVSGGNSANYNNGFGPIPGNTIRGFVSNHTCLANCPTCMANVTVGNLPNGPNHFEVSNTITATGNLPATSITVFDASVKVTLSPGFRANNGARLKIVNNGCAGIQK